MRGQIFPGFFSGIWNKQAAWDCAHFIGSKTKALKIIIFIVIALTVFLYRSRAHERFFDGMAYIPDIMDDHHPPPKGKSIFFLETSCNMTEGGIIQINARQACAVESAANLNSNSTVYLLYTLPLRYPNVPIFSSNKYKVFQELIKYKNIRIRSLDFNSFKQNTPLQGWDHTWHLGRSSYVIAHTSDVLRILLLWKYGGTYIDLDAVLMKNLEKLKPNYVGAESKQIIGQSIINFDHQNSGHHTAELCLKEIEMDFRGDLWAYNGPRMITKVLNNICKTTKIYAMTEKRCKGFNVLPPRAFYPIPWKNWKLYFDTQILDSVLERVNNSYAIHVWNKLTPIGRLATFANVPRKRREFSVLLLIY